MLKIPISLVRRGRGSKHKFYIAWEFSEFIP